MDFTVILRPFRKELVLAAEKVMEAAFKQKRPKLKKTQLNHLVTICNEAACVQELDNYLRYQASRKSAPWDLDLAKDVINGIKSTLTRLAALEDVEGSQRDRLQVEAWRLYAVFMTRAFTYHDKISEPPGQHRPAHSGMSSDRRQPRDDGPRNRGSRR